MRGSGHVELSDKLNFIISGSVNRHKNLWVQSQIMKLLLNTTVTFKLNFGCGPYPGLVNFFRKENKLLLCLSVTAVG